MQLTEGHGPLLRNGPLSISRRLKRPPNPYQISSTDRRTEWTEGQRQNYIPPTSSGDNKMLLVNCLKKCVKFVIVTGRFGPAWGILTWVVSALVLKGPFFILAYFFTKLDTCPSAHPYTYKNAYIITFRLWPKTTKGQNDSL